MAIYDDGKQYLTGEALEHAKVFILFILLLLFN